MMKKLLTLTFLTSLFLISVSESVFANTYFCELDRNFFIDTNQQGNFQFSGITKENFKFQIKGETIKFSKSGPMGELVMDILGTIEDRKEGGVSFTASSGGLTILTFADGKLIMSLIVQPFAMMIVMAKCDKF